MRHAVIYLRRCFGLLLIVITGCGDPSPEPINYGQDVCDYCRMTIVDPQFGSELVTEKGKIFRFDSIECLAAFEVTDKVPEPEIHSRWVTQFDDRKLARTEEVVFVHSDTLRSPMGVGLFAYARGAEETERHPPDARRLDWEAIKVIVTDAWKLKE